MKSLIKIALVFVIIFVVVGFLLEMFFFRTYLDKEPEITNLHESNFDFSSSKPFYFKVDDALYFSAEGKLTYNSAPIWKGDIKKVFVSPNGKYALIDNGKILILIDDSGKELFSIRDCTMIPVGEDRKTGRFIGSDIQWDINSNFFLVLQDRVWEKNYSKKNRSSIYKFSLKDKSFKPLADLNEEVYDCFFSSLDQKSLYYEFAAEKGDLAFKRIDLNNGKIISECFQTDALKLTNLNVDSIYFNYRIDQFQENSFDLNKIIVDTDPDAGTTLYYKDKDTLVSLLSGVDGYRGFKGIHFSFFKGGFFLPGNRFFIAGISGKSFTGQMVIDTKTFQIMKLKKQTAFYFNINSNDCRDFVFRYEIEPNVKFPSTVSKEIEGSKFYTDSDKNPVKLLLNH